ncbi:MAG: PilZ domain-containing protein [Bryobacteraceae bacterium]
MPTWPLDQPESANGESAAVQTGTPCEVDERRAEQRHHVEGEVILAPAGKRPVLIHARLVDISPSGFRASHAAAGLETGLIVQFRHAWANGEAKVVWNRTAGGAWESGFLILRRA